MRIEIKRLIAVFLLVVAGLPLISVLNLQLKQQLLKKEMKSRLADAALQTLSIPSTEVIWVEEHEILVHGKMFDIRNHSIKNGVYTFTGYFDIEETDVVEKMKTLPGKLQHMQTSSAYFSMIALPWLPSLNNHPPDILLVK